MSDAPREAAITAAADAVGRRLKDATPGVAIVLGSGLGFLAEEVQSPVRIPYADIPGFPQPGVAGHKGELVGGTLEGTPVIVQSGRFHLYEGHAADTAALPVRVFSRLGVRVLVVTNAAGGIRPTFQPGTLMLIADHINLMFRNPLIGPVLQGEERFPDMSNPYDPGLRNRAREVARDLRIPLEEGVYVGLLGPSYETPAEIRMLRAMGADMCGMSTVPEVIVANHQGARVLGISCVTNLAAGITGAALSHDEVTETAARVRATFSALLGAILAALGREGAS